MLCPILAGERLANFDIIVMDTKPTIGKDLSYTKDQVCAHQNEPVATGGKKGLPCTKVGRFLAVAIPRNTILTLCEVQVFEKLGTV
jgi:hypothetical protein